MHHLKVLPVITLATLSALGTAGCASLGGPPVHTVHCDGPDKSWDACAAAAAAACSPRGYDLVRRSDQDADAHAGGRVNDGFGGAVADPDRRSMVISCRNP
jgi:hypothetical protein